MYGDLQRFQITQEIPAFLSRPLIGGGVVKATLVPLAVDNMVRDLRPQQVQTSPVNAIGPAVVPRLICLKPSGEMADADGKS